LPFSKRTTTKSTHTPFHTYKIGIFNFHVITKNPVEKTEDNDKDWLTAL